MIIKADFGRGAYSMTCDNYYYYDSCSSLCQTTEKVRAICQSKNNCILTPSNSTFTDNCPNVIKQLKVWYQCVYTPIKTTGGNSNNASCVFPFTYKNSLYFQCTYEQQPNFVINPKRWCCTTSNCDSDFKWGNCPGKNLHYNLLMNKISLQFVMLKNLKRHYKQLHALNRNIQASMEVEIATKYMKPIKKFGEKR